MAAAAADNKYICLLLYEKWNPQKRISFGWFESLHQSFYMSTTVYHSPDESILLTSSSNPDIFQNRPWVEYSRHFSVNKRQDQEEYKIFVSVMYENQ